MLRGSARSQLFPYTTLFRSAVFGGHAMETVILRLANVYGPRDRDRVIPLFVENALNGLPLTVYSGAQILDFVHEIEDLGSAVQDRKSTRLNSSHTVISYAVF